MVGIEFEVIVPQGEERVSALPPCELCVSIAKQKALEVAATFEDRMVLAADTIVVCDGELFGKPVDYDDAFRMLTALSGREHRVFTGVVIKQGVLLKTFFEETAVEFYSLSTKEKDDYIKSGEPFDKAGGYGIQGKGALLVKKINGDFYNVMGLPVARVWREIDEQLTMYN